VARLSSVPRKIAPLEWRAPSNDMIPFERDIP
jgi:hypothetical protein